MNLIKKVPSKKEEVKYKIKTYFNEKNNLFISRYKLLGKM